MAKLKITLTGSLIGALKPQIRSAHALGLRKIHDYTLQPDNAQTRGKINKINHLVDVEEVQEGQE